ncbi:hypothetical protein [Micromonospora coxensis]
MDPRTARLLAWPFTLAAAALHFASEWWVEPSPGGSIPPPSA